MHTTVSCPSTDVDSTLSCFEEVTFAFYMHRGCYKTYPSFLLLPELLSEYLSDTVADPDRE